MWALSDLKPQAEWRGRDLVMIKGLLVCEICMDVPNQQDRTIKLRPDPVPVRDPRPIPSYQVQAAEAWDEPMAVWDDEITEWGE